MDVTTLKRDSVIKGIEIGSGLYEGLQLVVWKLSSYGPENLEEVKTLLVLLNEIDEKAKEQGLLDVISVKE
jgi:hypothetical protein